MGSRVFFLLALLCLAMLFNESLCTFSGSQVPISGKVVKVCIAKCAIFVRSILSSFALFRDDLSINELV